jgi:flagellar M-ring protein FliF
MLDSMLGVGQAAIVVNARLNGDQTHLESVVYGKAHGPVTSTSDRESLKGPGASAGGVSGTSANIPGYAAGSSAGGSGKTAYLKTHRDGTQAIDQTVIDTTRAGGDVKNMFVSLAFAPPAGAKGSAAAATGPCTPLPSHPALTSAQCNAAVAIESQLGISAADLHSGKATFAAVLGAPPAGATGGSAGAAGTGLAGAVAIGHHASAGPLDMVTSHLREGLVAAGVILLLLLVRRSLGRRQALLGSAEARWMPALAAPPIPVEEIALPEPRVPVSLTAASKKALQERVEELATNRPDDVARQLRGWLAEDS